MSEEFESAIGQLEVTHCPFCGSQIAPLMAFSGENGVKTLLECDTHGEFEVECNAA